MNARSTEARHSASTGLHANASGEVLALALDSQINALNALRPAFPAIEKAAEAGAAALRSGHKMAYAGAGSSGLMAMADCLELSGTFGVPVDRTPMLFAGGAEALLHMRGSVEDDPVLAQDDVERAGLGEGDVLLTVSASGSTPYALAAAEAAQAAGAVVVGIANVPDTLLLATADIPVLIDTGAEIIAGSTRLGAATAQKAALNLLSVMVGIKLGHVHDGHMVNLVADNAKLVARAARIVGELAQVPPPVAEAALLATKGAVKSAILVARGMAPDEASAALERTEGHLAPLLD
ncbi:N-acetylmuramic acid 6-phosphate etherase [Paracoccus aerodenitrificans]|uniref:N-acetylmuramic acid 6-phosphate etherase n=1 Tax=Paracoccus aerodenitrificans TaxID=3017781 RepID=UPI0022F03DBD|nr:N-acetylmuramic acid 6-phosphate etherase [Paracoccus aerodenitrificans]WBU63499.1 N-acetylmuramic acid 6-phosphate etherase [Paracoccus aerodenitrificans]